MTIDVDAIYEDGVLKPERPLQLEEKAKVHVTIEVKPATTSAVDDDPTGWKAADRLMGCITEPLIADDVVENHDRYIYRRDE
jgi:predicted DNA-binding antitoxin AbrB/MazE fold protein